MTLIDLDLLAVTLAIEFGLGAFGFFRQRATAPTKMTARAALSRLLRSAS